MPAVSIGHWLRDAAGQLADGGIRSAKLDAEILLAHTLRKGRTYLHAHTDEPLSDHHREIADARLRLRLDRTPIAYIVGHKEFYKRLFRVTPAVLVPRPESETIITLLKELRPHADGQLVDVGTGSGILGITAKLELPRLNVTLLDTSRHALKVAEKNAHHFGIPVTILQSDLLKALPFAPSIILANLPYVSPAWERSPETDHEPSLALFAEEDGLHLIYTLLSQAAIRLPSHGLLLLEADPRQHGALITRAMSHGFTVRETRGFIIALEKS
jgi:release factor glutamine methyltransferase